MNHRIGIAAYGRREMRVVVEGQTIVPDVVDAVFRLHHRAQGHALDDILLALALHVVDQSVQAPGYLRLRPRGLQLVAELHDELA